MERHGARVEGSEEKNEREKHTVSRFVSAWRSGGRQSDEGETEDLRVGKGSRMICALEEERRSDGGE